MEMVTKQIPQSHMDLLERPVVVSLATVNANGQPQVTPVWIDFEDDYVRVNSARGRKKVENMETRPQVTVLAIDPENPYRWMEIQGRIEEETEEGAIDHINKLSGKYRGTTDYYSRNPQMRGKETRLIFKIRPTVVITNG
jgi:PPOX class probable F420-dependent enzyme